VALGRFFDVGGLLSGIRQRIREYAFSGEQLPAILRLPVVRGFVERDILEGVRVSEILREDLRNVTRVRYPFYGDLETFVPGPRQMLAATVTIITPTGHTAIVRIGLPFETGYDPVDFQRRVTAAASEVLPSQYTGNTPVIMASVVGIDWYVQEFQPL